MLPRAVISSMLLDFEQNFDYVLNISIYSMKLTKPTIKHRRQFKPEQNADLK